MVHEADRLQRAVRGGLLSRHEAAHRLQQVSDGGLTLRGAADLIDGHRLPSERYEAVWVHVLKVMDGFI